MQQQQKLLGVNFIFLRKKGDCFGRFYAFYGQRSVTAAWATRSPWSIQICFLGVTSEPCVPPPPHTYITLNIFFSRQPLYLFNILLSDYMLGFSWIL